jgi:hypothetical protein
MSRFKGCLRVAAMWLKEGGAVFIGEVFVRRREPGAPVEFGEVIEQGWRESVVLASEPVPVRNREYARVRVIGPRFDSRWL